MDTEYPISAGYSLPFGQPRITIDRLIRTGAGHAGKCKHPTNSRYLKSIEEERRTPLQYTELWCHRCDRLIQKIPDSRIIKRRAYNMDMVEVLEDKTDLLLIGRMINFQEEAIIKYCRDHNYDLTKEKAKVLRNLLYFRRIERSFDSFGSYTRQKPS
tara:strand:+ start:211 stop:681 length:471 start_codon:yes stop_codon:yes gene_type:complete